MRLSALILAWLHPGSRKQEACSECILFTDDLHILALIEKYDKHALPYSEEGSGAGASSRPPSVVSSVPARGFLGGADASHGADGGAPVGGRLPASASSPDLPRPKTASRDRPALVEPGAAAPSSGPVRAAGASGSRAPAAAASDGVLGNKSPTASLLASPPLPSGGGGGGGGVGAGMRGGGVGGRGAAPVPTLGLGGVSSAGAPPATTSRVVPSGKAVRRVKPGAAGDGGAVHDSSVLAGGARSAGRRGGHGAATSTGLFVSGVGASVTSSATSVAGVVGTGFPGGGVGGGRVKAAGAAGSGHVASITPRLDPSRDVATRLSVGGDIEASYNSRPSTAPLQGTRTGTCVTWL